MPLKERTPAHNNDGRPETEIEIEVGEKREKRQKEAGEEQ